MQQRRELKLIDIYSIVFWNAYSRDIINKWPLTKLHSIVIR